MVYYAKIGSGTCYNNPKGVIPPNKNYIKMVGPKPHPTCKAKADGTWTTPIGETLTPVKDSRVISIKSTVTR